MTDPDTLVNLAGQGLIVGHGEFSRKRADSDI